MDDDDPGAYPPPRAKPKELFGMDPPCPDMGDNVLWHNGLIVDDP